MNLYLSSDICENAFSRVCCTANRLWSVFHLEDHIPDMITFDYVLKVGEAGTGETDQRAEENY